MQAAHSSDCSRQLLWGGVGARHCLPVQLGLALWDEPFGKPRPVIREQTWGGRAHGGRCITDAGESRMSGAMPALPARCAIFTHSSTLRCSSKHRPVTLRGSIPPWGRRNWLSSSTSWGTTGSGCDPMELRPLSALSTDTVGPTWRDLLCPQQTWRRDTLEVPVSPALAPPGGRTFSGCPWN